MEGNFVWYEYMAADAGKAKQFYTDVFGWDIVDWTPDEGESDGDYEMFAVGEDSFGGIMNAPEGPGGTPPPHWIGYVEVSDVDETAERIEQLGGRVVHGPDDIPQVGRFCVALDPSGVAFSPFKSASSEDEDWEPGRGLGFFGWHELYCEDLDETLGFYGELFGWKAFDTMETPAGDYVLFGLHDSTEDDAALGGMIELWDDAPVDATWNFYVTVSDVEETIEKVEAAGGTKITGPDEVPGGLTAVFADPVGVTFAAHQRTQ